MVLTVILSSANYGMDGSTEGQRGEVSYPRIHSKFELAGFLHPKAKLPHHSFLDDLRAFLRGSEKEGHGDSKENANDDFYSTHLQGLACFARLAANL